MAIQDFRCRFSSRLHNPPCSRRPGTLLETTLMSAAPRLLIAAGSVVDLLAAARVDPAALGPLLEQYREPLLRVAREWASSGHHWAFGESAVVQDSLVSAIQHFHEFRGG